jgi:hypothetical protein
MRASNNIEVALSWRENKEQQFNFFILLKLHIVLQQFKRFFQSKKANLIKLLL